MRSGTLKTKQRVEHSYWRGDQQISLELKVCFSQKQRVTHTPVMPDLNQSFLFPQ